MRKRIFQGMCYISITAIIISSLIVAFVLFKSKEEQTKDRLKNYAHQIEIGYINYGTDYLYKTEEANARITLIDENGKVVFDNSCDASKLENHNEREEIQEARTNGTGYSRRLSTSIGNKNYYYYAILLEKGYVLRVSDSVRGTVSELSQIVPWIVAVAIGTILLSVVEANRLTKKIIEPINTIDVEKPDASLTYDEISPLLLKIIDQNSVIKSQMDKLKEKQREFTAITENMAEGFIVIDTKKDVLSYNFSALRLLDATICWNEDDKNGINVLTLNRSEPFRRAIDKVLTGAKAEEKLEIKGRLYSVIANPVLKHKEVMGGVLLIVDVTEKEQRENLRKEFTTNVSHELKTPLTSISGYAEIIENGIAKPEDIPEFAAKIHHEAQRLISVVVDIIKLAQLDENTLALNKESVDLLALTEKVIGYVADSATKKDINIELNGKTTVVEGIPQVLEEMIFNLCDNAVKYNKVGGSVFVEVGDNISNGKYVMVKDTGIGISREHQERIFERFYRVDKSHSKEIGGTGLGLSIVKHGALYHGAEVKIQSEKDKGTEILICWKK